MTDWKAIHRKEPSSRHVAWSSFNGWAAEFGSSIAHYITGQIDQVQPYMYSSHGSFTEGWVPLPGGRPGEYTKPNETRPVVRPRTVCGRIFSVSHGVQRGTLQFSPAGPESACERCSEIQRSKFMSAADPGYAETLPCGCVIDKHQVLISCKEHTPEKENTDGN